MIKVVSWQAVIVARHITRGAVLVGFAERRFRPGRAGLGGIVRPPGGGRGCGAASRRPVPAMGRRAGVVKPTRARGGCLGVIRDLGVEGCEMRGGAA